jgi:uncharacterized membrane protein
MKTQYYHYAALTGYFGLFGLLMLWNTVLAPSSRFPVAMVLLVLVTPLLLPLKGLLSANLKSCAWTAYLSLIYFIHGTGEVYSNENERLLASLEVIFSLLLFFGATFYVRFSGRARK